LASIYHDGQITAKQAEFEDDLHHFSAKKLYKYKENIAVGVIYAQT
jgi:hypothetical protein